MTSLDDARRGRHTAPPSSGTVGFFQTPPTITNQFHDDRAFRRAFNHLLRPRTRDRAAPSLARFGQRVLATDVQSHIRDAEAHPPTLAAHTALGQPTPPHRALRTSDGWRRLQALGIEEGIVAIPYEREFGHESRIVQALKIILWAPSCANVGCPSAMTDGAAALLATQLARPDEAPADGDDGDRDGRGEALREAYERLTSRDPERAWTSGQWMTERRGGSDVRGTETLATYARDEAGADGVDVNGHALGPWEVSGFKFFSSATDADTAVLLARTPSSASNVQPSPDISAFFAPMLRRPHPTSTDDTTPASNGVSLHRLKSKLGTRPLPTAELALHRTRAHLLGAPGAGTRVLAPVLNLTRLHTALSAVGYWGRGLAVARAYARVRRIGVDGPLLRDVPAHVKGLAGMEVEYAAVLQLAVYVAAQLGVVEGRMVEVGVEQLAPSRAVRDLGVERCTRQWRLLAPVVKVLASLAAVRGLRCCMEALGGVGYLEHEEPVLMNVARLFRDANVLPIWEGTGDVLAADVVRVLKGRGGEDVMEDMGSWVEESASGWTGLGWQVEAARVVRREWKSWEQWVKGTGADELRYHGHEMLERLGWIVCAVLLVNDAAVDGDDVAAEVARRWIAKVEAVAGDERDWKSESTMDRAIVFGVEERRTSRL